MDIKGKCNERIQFYTIARGIFESHKNSSRAPYFFVKKNRREKSHINLFTKIGLKEFNVIIKFQLQKNLISIEIYLMHLIRVSWVGGLLSSFKLLQAHTQTVCF